MRIAVLSETYPTITNPVPNAFVHVRARTYQTFGHKIVVVAGSDKDTDDRYFLDEVQVIRVSNVNSARKFLDSWSPDIVCIHAPIMGGFAPTLVQRVSWPVVAWIHGYEALVTAFYGYHIWWPKAMATIPRDVVRIAWLKWFLKQIQGVVYVSEWMKRIAERNMAGFSHRNSWVIPNGVDTEVFKPVNKKRDIWGKGLSVRGLGSRKYGIDVAIRAYGQVEGTTLTVVGDGVLKKDYDELIHRLKSRTVIDSRRYRHDDMPNLYNQFNYFVAPSRTEAQGVAMTEAMSCGLPVVATTAGGIPEFVSDGVDGFLCKPGSVFELRKCIERLVRDPIQMLRMGASARENIVKKCDLKMVIDRELKILTRIVAECSESSLGWRNR